MVLSRVSYATTPDERRRGAGHPGQGLAELSTGERFSDRECRPLRREQPVDDDVERVVSLAVHELAKQGAQLLRVGLLDLRRPRDAQADVAGPGEVRDAQPGRRRPTCSNERRYFGLAAYSDAQGLRSTSGRAVARAIRSGSTDSVTMACISRGTPGTA